MAFRVPVPDVSVVDLTVRLKKPVRCGPKPQIKLWFATARTGLRSINLVH